MVGIILAGVIVVILVAALCCLIVKLGSEAKMGRRVDVRVLSCEQKGQEENRLYYEMKVDFYDANGEALVRIMQSEKKYMPGDMIRCRYVEKTRLLFEEMTPEVRKKSKNNLLLFLVVFLIFAGIVAAVIGGRMNGKELSNEAVGYFISILFMAVGIFGIYQKNQMKYKMAGMVSLPGIQVDYTVTKDMDREGSWVSVYHPVYEYQWEGERRRIPGQVGSSGKKYRTIGRKVNILVDPHTGKGLCREDEKTKENYYLGFGIIGLIVFALLLAHSFGAL